MILNHHHVLCVEVRGVKEVPIKRTIVNCIINKYGGVCIKIHPSSDPNLLFASLPTSPLPSLFCKVATILYTIFFKSYFTVGLLYFLHIVGPFLLLSLLQAASTRKIKFKMEKSLC